MARLYILKPRANNGVRTRDPQLGKLMLYQLSYIRVYRVQKYRNLSYRLEKSTIFQLSTEQLKTVN